MGKENKLKLLTFNTWGLKYLSTYRKERLTAIADTLAGEKVATPIPELEDFVKDEDYNFDIIALQEIWSEDDWNYITKKCKTKYPYSRLFYSGIVSGPGLAILSKIPIQSTNLYRFPINGLPTAITRGDWFVGKSVAITTFEVAGQQIAVFNSHMHAPYALSGSQNYKAHRSVQAWDFNHLVQLYKKAGYATILVGDLNSRPGSLPYSLLIDSGLSDSWELSRNNKKDDLVAISKMTPAEQIIEGCTTCDTILNTWRTDICEPDEAQRLDYALVDSDKFDVLDGHAIFTDIIPHIGSFSDHFAYTCTLVLKDPSSTANSSNIEDSVVVGNSSLIDNENDKIKIEQRVAIYTELLETIQDYVKTCNTRDTIRQSIAAVSFLTFFFLIILYLSKGDPQNLSNYKFVTGILIGVLLTLTFVFFSLIGLAFGRSERRAFKEVENEVTDILTSLNTNNKTYGSL
ncbi:hypothetical protein TBLA_0A05330 [Henningerozyma blattae CBS 6284]|uniref:Endonuclease/exonuclease/phosphatase domain-containing protein n=1 Tax=Henningerozyma blattae (strain ATCC 34711 / CBS 6284 / DSM 70876 / NBRC 10599 / NRRL Y-10934 / UCD 77-7) TaxID=1071380 RepID=I2GW24_HENB6|nr:hypothetical protein TBLA_0A05330 [Tetrapisispora blattae CBS 6284]CCH58326.1 hypothetical protein TBLA_0A05330 [Tetrapisispora blattae CBS 6284]